MRAAASAAAPPAARASARVRARRATSTPRTAAAAGPRRASALVARAELKSGGNGRYARPDEAKSPLGDEEIFWDPADLEDEDPEPLAFANVADEDFDDDDDDDDDDAWFFVPDEALANGAKTSEVDLFVVGEDYDDDGSFGFVQSFVDEDDEDDDFSRPPGAARGNPSHRRRDRTARDRTAVEKTGRGAIGSENAAGGGERAELTPKERKERRKKEEDTRRMLSMGVPESLLRRLEEEQLAVKALDARKKRENARKTHRRLTIVAGKLGKRKLLSPSGLDTRPMMGMVRGATFDMLMSLVGSRSNVQFPDPGARWLDLFAGTGAIGLEALSRGAAEAHFVEMDPWVSSNVLNKNIKTLGVTARCTTHVAKVETFLERHELSAKAAGGAFDFVSFCPPYYKVSYPDLLAKLDASPLLSAETLVIVEYARSQKPEMKAAIGRRLRRLRDRRYGRTFVAVYACDGREMPDEDDEWAEQPEEATRFGKVVRGAGKGGGYEGDEGEY